jgi:hypothetical protein
MKTIFGLFFCLLTIASACGQERTANGAKASDAKSASLAATLEAHVRKAWKNYQDRNKQTFADILAPGFSEVTDGAEGAFGKDAELSEMDRFTLAHYELSNFKVRPLGRAAALVTYSAKYEGSYDKAPLDMKTLYGEVWVRSGADWKLLWVQETKLK